MANGRRRHPIVDGWQLTFVRSQKARHTGAAFIGWRRMRSQGGPSLVTHFVAKLYTATDEQADAMVRAMVDAGFRPPDEGGE